MRCSERSPNHPILEDGGVEVDQQSELLLEQPHIGEQLRVEHRQHFGDALDLDDDPVLDDAVDDVGSNTAPLVEGRDLLLAGVGDLAFIEFDAQRRLVDRLEQSWSENTVDGDRRADDRAGDCSLMSRSSVALCLCGSIISCLESEIS